MQPATSSGSIAVTTGAQTVTGAGTLLHIECIGGSAAGTVTVYDGTSTAGKMLVSLAGVAIGTTQICDLGQGVVFNTGLFIVVSGAASQGIVHYRLG